ncbi:MAG TPA: hypothetical protein PLY93_14880, partial [Turneriella sp.]|nr:hypothetical protein [Turneriella sp.]
MRGVRNIFLLALPWLFACGQKLDLFLNEDKEIVLTIESETTMSPTISIVEGKFHFNVTFHLDRKGNYYFYHGGSCNVDNNFLITSGTLIKDTAVSVKVGITFSNITAHGKTVTLCVEDTAAYKKKSHSFDFSGVLTSIAQFINEGIGSYSLSNSSSTTTEFVLFQNDWTGVNPHRSTGSVVQNGVQLPRYHTAFIDPNDGYRLKYAVVDTANHRVLLFNKPPTAGFDSANVVVGQTSFIAGNTNAGGVVSCSGFDTPTHVSVSASGVLFVTDASNNRVLGFGQAPTTNGASANFV